MRAEQLASGPKNPEIPKGQRDWSNLHFSSFLLHSTFFITVMAPNLKRKNREVNDEIPTGNAAIKKKIRDTNRALQRVSEKEPRHVEWFDCNL